MSTKSIELTDENFRFVEERAKREGLSVSEAIERLVAFLRRTEQRPLHPDVLSLMGILRGVDTDDAQYSYLRSKHL
jgi:hypothetical protein